MSRNPARRAALIDAAIEVLAREGARGLTYRAVDTEAAVPPGTTSNYFTNRDDLLNQVAPRVHERLTPDPDAMTETMKAPRDAALETELLRGTLDRISQDRSGYLALMELRLEATRRPALHEALTRTMNETLGANIRFHLDAGLPGDEMTVVLLYLAMTGLVIEELTLPEALAPFTPDAVIEALASRVLPQDP
ncbi:TetR family transcriptional regulator [Streptomyces sp. HD1123-B1]|uniref:TetR/AcrR family transcriptional regulator n=1 Tax=Streptomyces TaxID=1883 RepID=UPI0020C88220|nr:TetR/AcrR family transcriptional regulator [Streptomyces sp. NEAU-Y11]MCP9208236.1 TetR family transcriptional regulator [Streptomyces sp. NEAU-Y11]